MTPNASIPLLEGDNAVYPEVYLQIASLRGQDMRNHAAHERRLRGADGCQENASANHRRDAAYRRLAVAILGLDIKTVSGALRSAHR